MNATLMTITPEWAQKILTEKNTRNRPLNRLHVASLAKEIRCGRWKLNGDTICLSDNRLIDGQHRLAAIHEAGVPVQSFVVEGVSCDVFDTKDVGKRRSPGDTLGVRGESNSSRLASALVVIDRYFTGRSESTVSYTNTEVEELLEKYPGARDSIQTANKGRSIIFPSVLDACHYLFSQKDKNLANEFVAKIIHGTGLQEGSPWYVLRERLMKNSLSKAKLSRPYVMALCIKAWNSARVGASVRCLRWRESGDQAENFPLIK